MEARDNRNVLVKQKCKEKYTYQLDYLRQFHERYETINAAKFSLAWMVDLAHDNINGLYHADNYLANYFLENKRLFDNSFIFIVGDHGKHYGMFAEIEV
jgi:hypothetical protein